MEKRGRMLKKKGQVTIFIIIGIILLIAVALLIIFRKEITIFTPERLVPTETTKVVRYIEDCMKTTSDMGLNIMGAQGGYIYLPAEIEFNPKANLDQGLKVPMWQYLEENRIPSLELMEAHLSRYMNENFRGCVDNLEAFQEQYDVVELGPVTTETNIAEENVIFTMNYPIEVRSKDGTKITDLEEFQLANPIKLKKVYEVSRQIMEKEAEEYRLEKITIDLISLDPETPISGFDLDCAKKIWRIPEVEAKLKTLLRTNLPSLRVDRTDYLAVPKDQPYVLNHYIWSVTDKSYPEVKASFRFSENQPMQLAITPSDGQLLKSGGQKGAEMISFVCLQTWKFNYDIIYPVVVTVNDAINNYNFNFAFDVRIRDNKPFREPLGEPAQFFNEIGGSTEAYCGNVYGDYQMKVFTFDNVSDPTYGESYEPIKDVNITFTCLKYTCPMGQSRFYPGQSQAYLEMYFPYCPNGVLRGMKEGYKTALEFVTTSAGKEVNLYLTPLKEIKNYQVVKHVLRNDELGAAEPLADDESAYIVLKYVKNTTTVHETAGSYPATADLALPAMEFLAGADFPYEVEIFLMKGNDLVGNYKAQWQPEWFELKPANEIIFHTVATGAAVSDAQLLEFMLQVESLSQEIPLPEIR